MNIVAVFGATGDVGIQVTKKALAHGMKVRALVRDPSRVPHGLRSKITVEQGDVTNADDVFRTVKGSDAVVVTLGVRNDYSPTTVLSEGMKNIVTAMKALQVEVVSVCFSVSLFLKESEIAPTFRPLTADRRRMLDVLKASGLKWVAVLPPYFTYGQGGKYVVVEGSSPGNQIAVVDLSEFLVESLLKPEHYNKILGIANTA